jgi:hypothetical protein
MLDFKRVVDILGGLTLLKFFPSDPVARLELAKLVGRMASTEQQVEWLVQRTLDLHSEWPGPHELRAIMCSRFKPADGINAVSSFYPDGIPHDPRLPRIEPAPLPALPPGHQVTADPELDQMIQRTKDFMAKLPPRRILTPLPELPCVVDGQFAEDVPVIEVQKRITQEDIDRAVEEMREKRGRTELEA